MAILLRAFRCTYRCICLANSPTPLCPDFPDCLPGGEA